MEISLERNSEYMKLQYLFLHILHYLTDLNEWVERVREKERWGYREGRDCLQFSML